MKSYPIIPYWNKGHFGEQCYAFEKLDGSNIRAEWSKKQGWYKFGSRKQIIDSHDSQLGEAVRLFYKNYAEDLTTVFRNKYREALSFVVFFEFFGPKSFAGWHDPKYEMEITLFDVNQYKRGFIEPKEFI